ncbi:hypothetical protein CDES_02705 [Corynebacterium deserti GIMN1.010]|uniref:HTH araC/xylS-type domain-containing protein n=1 Tax=Corynebacterium deserti GIMN1.010 TaxID=931089 RepID=A0A0M4CH01_9CORY|nr:helix-turn-helix domain-containing protein [Corynebacterium deserti]ALC04996.1 hypothetical protein CDES_02705 [Corynebacterium deserti GIMN1.010]
MLLIGNELRDALANFLTDEASPTYASQLLRALNNASEIVPFVFPKSPEAWTVASHMWDNMREHSSIDELAKMVHVSSRTLGRQFLAETGMTFNEWRRETRFAGAFDLLKGPEEVSIEFVSHAVGFTNVSSFTRAFRKRFDRTPGQIQRAQATRRKATQQNMKAERAQRSRKA